MVSFNYQSHGLQSLGQKIGKDYDNALRELQDQLSKGISLNELQTSHLTARTKSVIENREQARTSTPFSYQRRHNVEEWLQKNSEGHARRTNLPSSALMDLLEKSVGRVDVTSKQSYHLRNYDIVLTKIMNGNYHVLVAANTKGTTVLHWGVAKSNLEEWLPPPPEILPVNSKLVSDAYGSPFPNHMDFGTRCPVGRDGEGFVKWLLDEISQRERG
ncbi:Alpha-glucan water dikinase 2 [Quillaja saponaria]|uniref:Alpha-glucan water dikinase 2 n=1 Tax=Quillaja saponaria TaxID=32244 RepID=A0AAD7PT44_QUISA|nr:Alpha-glucan water dikinase 2 [Quillaja saponaria]